MRISHRYADTLMWVAGATVILLLAAGSLQLGAVPAALAQQTCPAGQTYCPSGSYAGQCRANTATCTGGSYSACSGCVCPAGQVLCGTTCQAPKRCPDANRSTSDQCAASDAASCGACAGGYTLDAGTCVLQSPVILAPLNPQERSSDRPSINVVQGGDGLLFNLQAQSGTDSATRRQIFSADKTGIMVGYDPIDAKLGIDLSAAGGQNLIYGIAQATGLDDELDSLLKLQVRAGSKIYQRFRVDGSGNAVAAGRVTGTQLCIGTSAAADCKSSWESVAGVKIQGATPGTAQTGNFNVSGTGIADTLQAKKLNLLPGGIAGTIIEASSTISEFSIATKAATVAIKLDSDKNETPDDFRVVDADGVIRFYVTDSGDVMVGRNLDVVGGIQAGTGNVNIIDSTGKIPALSSTYFASHDLQGALISNASWISGGATGATPPALRFVEDGDVVLIPRNTGTGRGLIVTQSAVDPTIVGYAKLWHDGTSTYISDTTNDTTQGMKITSGNLDVSGSITAGSGNIGIVDDAGKIPALSSTYFASLSGANLTGLNASNLASGTVADARLPAGLLRNPIDGGASSIGPWLTIQGGASVLENIALRLYDAGTADGNMSTLEFAHNMGSGPTSLAFIKSVNVGINAASGAKLKLTTASNNTGTFNTDQLVLSNDGRVGIGVVSPGARLHVATNTGSEQLEMLFDNAAEIGAKNSTGTMEGFLWPRWTDNATYLNYGSGGLNIRDSASASKVFVTGSGNIGIATTAPNTKLSVYSGDESTTLTDFTQALTKAGVNILTDYTAGAYTPGIFWSTSNNNATKPKAGIWLLEDGSGTDMLFGTSNSYATGITNTALTIDQSGNLAASGDLTAKNSYECVNVGTELRCNLRQYWRIADKTSGYVESWVGSDTCTNICSSAGLRTCTDIQFNYECPDGTLMQSWQDDDPGEFDPSERTCSSSEPYRATVSGVTCSGQSGTEYKRYRCRCQS